MANWKRSEVFPLLHSSKKGHKIDAAGSEVSTDHGDNVLDETHGFYDSFGLLRRAGRKGASFSKPREVWEAAYQHGGPERRMMPASSNGGAAVDVPEKNLSAIEMFGRRRDLVAEIRRRQRCR